MYQKIRDAAHEAEVRLRGDTAVHAVESQPMTDPIEDFARRKVLIVDRDIADLPHYAEPFEAHGFEVHKCASFEAGMRSVERDDFDLALVDQGSRLFDGRRVIRHLIRYNSRTPFIVLAFPKDSNCYQQAVELGAVEYLEKPVSTEELDRIIERYLGNTTCIF